MTDTFSDAAPSGYRISGIVVNSVTNSPVAGAEVNASPMSARRGTVRSTGQSASHQGAAGVTDESGHFAVDLPSAGGWSLTVSARGYHTQALDEHEGYSSAIVLTDTEPMYNVTFQLPPASAIEGYVVDEAGEPVRNGQLTLSQIPAATPENDHGRHQVRGTQLTDDRGFYKFSGLSVGNYEIRLQAQPWYATSTAGQRVGGSLMGSTTRGVSSDGQASGSGPGSGASSPDPLDVVYPTLWFPGVTDFSAAAPLTLRAGEVREANFHLSPIPGFHLRIAASSQGEEGRRSMQGGAYLSQMLPDGGEAVPSMVTQTDAQGNTEVSGLVPGTYQVHRQGEAGGSVPTVTLQISPNSSRTVDLSQAAAFTPVTVRIDAAADVPALQITFRDLETGRESYVSSSRGSNVRGARRRPSVVDASGGADADQATNKPGDHFINLPPGRYEVILTGIGDLHLSSIEPTGATATGRIVTIAGGAPSLKLHVASGRANLTGFVSQQGVATEGAMVLLVPATLGDPAGLSIVRRDQTNTDGSFDLENVLPGAYILIAIDHGWDVNWRDASTLGRFLMHGIPLDLTAPGNRKVNLEAQSP